MEAVIVKASRYNAGEVTRPSIMPVGHQVVQTIRKPEG